MFHTAGRALRYRLLFFMLFANFCVAILTSSPYSFCRETRNKRATSAPPDALPVNAFETDLVSGHEILPSEGKNKNK